MRRAIIPFVFLVLSTQHLLAVHPKLTEAERDGLNGAVKSVSTTVALFKRDPDAADHPVIVYPVFCQVCEYDAEGNSTRRGQNVDGTFFGDKTWYVRNEDGSIRERISADQGGQVFQKIMLGPYGKAQELDYRDGVLQFRQTFSYDNHGNMIEWLTFDRSGNETASTTTTFDEEGNVTEQFDRGSGNSFLHFTKHFDPVAGIETFTNYNEDGTVRLTYTAKDDKITNYWQQPSDKHEYGGGICFNTGPTERACEHHYPDGKVWHDLATFADEKRSEPLRVELRDETGLVRMAADYEYQSDSRSNWTRRSVWVWRSDSAERILWELDVRKLTYWK